MNSAWGEGGGLDSEFTWTRADFVRIQALIYQYAGISLHDGKSAMVYSRLSRRLRETGHCNFKDYLDCLNVGDELEWQEFVNALTTNLTSFFREKHHFEILKNHFQSRRDVGYWRIWCAAASTGEEPYSIAMASEEILGFESFSLIASDINTGVLSTAVRGIYKLSELHGVSTPRRHEFFLRGTSGNSGLVRVKPKLRHVVDFVNINLIQGEWPFLHLFDVVFCRNVMIYFDSFSQRKVLERIHKAMAPGALLFVGHAENLSDASDLFSLRGKTVYERR